MYLCFCPLFRSLIYFIFYSGQENLEDRLLGTRNVVQALPQANLDLLRRVSEHLDKLRLSLFVLHFLTP